MAGTARLHYQSLHGELASQLRNQAHQLLQELRISAPQLYRGGTEAGLLATSSLQLCRCRHNAHCLGINGKVRDVVRTSVDHAMARNIDIQQLTADARPRPSLRG